MSNDYFMKITEDQREILNKAIKFLKKYDNEKYSGRSYFFTDENGHNIDTNEDYDCCDDESCIKQTIKEIEMEGYKNPTLNLRGGDYNRIDHCHICGCPLNGSLTWIKSELNHHEEYSITKDELQESDVAFDVRVMFEAMPTCDYEIREYTKAHPELLPAALQRQSDFVNRVVKYASKVIEVLKEK